MPDMAQILSFLPAILAVITPPIVQMIKKLTGMAGSKIPKVFLPVVAAVIGAIGEGLVTGGVTVVGPTAGLAGTGVRDVVKFAKPSS